MVFSKIHSAQPNILKAEGIDIETDITIGLHSFSIVGLPDKSVEESRDRVSSAIKNSGFKSPKQQNHKLTISLSPADIKKSGTIFDLPIALGYLKSSKQINFNTKDKIFVGELSLDGKVKEIKGVIQTILYAKEKGFKEVYIPQKNNKQASIIKGIKIYCVENLNEVIEHLKNCHKIPELINQKIKINRNFLTDFKNIKGNNESKRVLLIAGAGGHNICLHGPPGTGKTLLAKAFCEVLPHLSYEKIIETSSIHSISGISNHLITRPPLRNPHHTASYSAIIGGGQDINPGEITLAHNGILFMDEFPEFNRRVIDSLRQPIEEKRIRIARTNQRLEYPCDFKLVITLNPCPCGFKNSKIKECKCSGREIENYKRKISGPIADRIDLFTEVSKINYKELLNKREEESSEFISQIIKKTQDKQFQRQSKLNSELSEKELQNELDNKIKKEFNNIAEKINLSTRSYFKIIKVARTIADIESEPKIKIPHILEALQYRNNLNY